MKRWIAPTVLALAVILVQVPSVFQWLAAPFFSREETLNYVTSAPPVLYRANVTVDPDAHRVSGELSVRMIPKDRRHVYFHLYPNVFRDGSRTTDANWGYILGKNAEPGEISLRDVSVQGKPVAIEVKDTVVDIPLHGEVKADEETEVHMSFDLKLPHNNGRLSYDDHAMWLGNWLPILAVRQTDGWRLDPYYPIGDPFYSDVADYQVTVSLPDSYQLATSGVESQALVSESRSTKRKEYEVRASRVRDFAMVVMDKTYQPLTTRVGHTYVKTWAQTGDPDETVNRLHEAAVEALGYYNRAFGTYPYPEYDVVKTGGFFGGMEYPGIVFVEKTYFDKPVPQGAAVVAHETAHQWFYGLVGNDEVNEAWVDESLADYATMAFLKQYDRRLAAEYIANRTRRGEEAAAYARQGLSVWQPLYRFPDWRSYIDLVYGRGATMLWKLQEVWGEDRVNLALRYYVQKHLYKLASGEDVISAFSQVAGSDAQPYFDYWLRLDDTNRESAEAWMGQGKNSTEANTNNLTPIK